MKHLFRDEGRQALAVLMRAAPLLAFDFDGTLAPIVERSGDAAVPQAMARQLAALAAWRPVAIVTGRRVLDVLPRLGFKPCYVVGNHGAEAHGESAAVNAASHAVLDGLRARLAAEAKVLADAGVWVEDKGLSLALHYRDAADPLAATAHVEAALGVLDPRLARFGGKCVVNVVLADAPDKGDAVVSLAGRAGAGTVLFVGDDVNDEAVFHRAPPHWLTVRIGLEDPASQARFFLNGHGEMEELLRKMLTLIDAPGAGMPGHGQPAREPPPAAGEGEPAWPPR